MYSKYQFEERDKKSSGRWHPWGWLMRVLFFAVCLIHPRLDDLILAGAVCILVFELGINKIALHESWLHVGSTGWWDRTIGKRKWWAMGLILAAAITIKVFSPFIPWI